MVRTDRHQLRPVAGDSDLAEAVKVVARAHQTLIWDGPGRCSGCAAALLEFFLPRCRRSTTWPLPMRWNCWQGAPDPAAAAGSPARQITAALKRPGAGRCAERAEQIQAVLRAEQLAQPERVAAAYAATVRSQVAVHRQP